MAKKPKAKRVDKYLREALTKAYTARASLFHETVAASGIDLLIAEIDDIQDSSLSWEEKGLGISDRAFSLAKESKARPHQVFVHPDVLQKRPHLLAYYRNLAAISQKGIAQLHLPTTRYESGRAKEMTAETALSLCKVLNQIISGIIESTPKYMVDTSRKVIFAELGAQVQGTWANRVGQGASREVEKIIAEHVERNKLGEKLDKKLYRLKNGWTIRFGSEPDVAFLDAKGMKRIAIEIKGSLDVAGAQTRYGEAKKSFAKQLRENPRCHTVYLASCFTEAVIEQIKEDGQVRDWLNLTAILSDEAERASFVKVLFHIVDSPGR